MRFLSPDGRLTTKIVALADGKAPIPHDIEMYKWRHLIGDCFQRLKEFRRLATRTKQDEPEYGDQ